MGIQQTTDYKSFRTILGNRKISEAKVKKLIQDIEGGLNLLPYCPILVYSNDNLYFIIDGQHRAEVSERLNEPIYFIECNKLTLQQIAKINSRSDKWTNRNFLDCYIKLGLEDYKEFYNFTTKYHIIYSATASFLMKGDVTSANIMEVFRDGNFKCNFYKEASRIVELTADLFQLYVFYNDRYLIEAIRQLDEAGKCDFKILKTKIKSNINLMKKKDTIKEYKFLIEQVYNHRNSKRIPIF